MNDTIVTLHGHVGGEVRLRQAGDAQVASFRVASTPRRYQRKTDTWVDAETQWYTVSAWRGLADNVAASLSVGDPVVVHGRLSMQTWTNGAGIEVSSCEIEAMLVGHDLTRGTSRFTRAVRASDGQGNGQGNGQGDGEAPSVPDQSRATASEESTAA